MISARDIKGKIRTVHNIEQICRAMKTVASIRLRRAEERLRRARPYRQGMADLVVRAARATQGHPFLQERPGARTAMLVVTSDRGLCGGYNANAVRRALATGTPDETVVAAVGRRGEMQLARRGYEIVERVVPIGGEPEAAAISRLADRLGERCEANELGRLVMVYARFLGGARSEVQAQLVLPVAPKEEAPEEVIFEPPAREMLPGLMRRYLRAEVLGAVLEASASEHAARVAAMSAATDNAEEMIRSLTLEYNKARQAGITSELAELVGAAEATA